MKSKRKFINRLTDRYLLTVRNEENFAEKATLPFTYGWLIFFLTLVCLVILGVSILLVNTVLSQWFDPRAAQAEANRRLVRLAMAVDSLETEVDRKDQFIGNIQKIVKGDSFNDDESNYTKDTVAESETMKAIRNQRLPSIDSQFRKEFEEDEALELMLVSNNNASPLDEIYFFVPLSGIVSAKFNSKESHYGVDIVSRKNEPVKSVADGTVILSSWTQDAGYVVAIQHRNNITSFYKHNSSVMKQVGDYVNAGDVVAIIGNSGELTTGPHLHFELWYNGNPVNPEEFISF